MSSESNKLHRCLVSLGANLGDPKHTIRTAVSLLADQFGEEAVAPSSLYRTPPVGGPVGQDDFFNAVVAIKTTDSPYEVWGHIRRIETTLGRQRLQRWEARRIDLDLLLFDTETIWTPRLKVPHPRMSMRRFILQPAGEVAGDWIDPVSTLSVSQLCTILESKANLMLLANTDSLMDRVLAELQVALPSNTSIRSEQVTSRVRSIELAIPGDRVRKVFCAITNANGFDEFQDHLGNANPTTEYPALSDLGQLIVMVASPDPTIVAWEDIARDWAVVLGMHRDNHMERSKHPRLGRYILNADDPKWAAHEILASFKAMDCVIHREEPMF